MAYFDGFRSYFIVGGTAGLRECIYFDLRGVVRGTVCA